MRTPDHRTLELLEWDRIREALAGRTATPGGARAARNLAWLEDRAAVEESLAEIAEAIELEIEGAVPDRTGAADLEPPLERLRAGRILEDEELIAVAGTLRAAAAARRTLRGAKQTAPRLARRAGSIPDLEEIAAAVLDSYTSRGALADHASPDLRRRRREANDLRTQILSLMEKFQARHADILSDTFTTLRDDRFVLPVRADAHESFPGIVHGTSQSGATLFVEPEPVVALANRLRVALAAVEREEARIRTGLTETLRERTGDIELADRFLAAVDLKFAAATLARNLDLHPPRLADRPGLRLVGARHPILLLTGREVVPGNLEVGTGKTLLVSGPNSGGKTVALKTASLCALMLRAGLPLPAAAGSEAGLFGNVLADIGDNQSLDLSLSTFSARMVALARILGDARAGDLVALDEVCAGTDPEEGAALAASVLETLVERGVAVIGTTHFPALKELALGDPRMENASVGYDPETLEPTFRLVTGIPGPSTALHVAERCGVPAAVVKKARIRVPETRRALSGASQRIHAERKRAEEALREAEARLREAEAARQAARRELEEGRAIGKKKAQQEARQLVEAVKRARRQVEEAEKKFRKPRLRRRDLEKAKRTLQRTAKAVSPAGAAGKILAPAAPEGKPAAGADLKNGTRVWLAGWNREAVVLREPDGDRVRVAAGSMQLSVPVADLRVLGGPAAAKSAPRRGLADTDGVESEDAPVQTPDNTLDLRGLFADEAVDAIDPFLDRLLQLGRTAGFLIHGHGTGKLKRVVRRHVAASKYIRRHRPGGPGEGGDGVTVVWIR